MEEQVKDKWEEEEVYEPGMEPQQEEEAQQEEEPQEQEKEPAVLAKDGEHIIPYSELEKARRELQELRQQNELLKQFAAQNMQKQASTVPGALPSSQPDDPIARLLEMDRDSFKSYVSEKGVDALYELREAVKRKAEVTAEAKAKFYTATALSRMVQESKQRALRGVVTDWAEENKDLLQDPMAAELIRAVDRALFQQKGITDLDQLGPTKAKKHLDEVTERVRKMLGGQQQQAQPAAAAQQPAAPSLSRLAGEGGKPKSLADMSGVDLEMAMLNMSQEDIEKLFEE